ncbi:MAG: hypothetical protein MJZ68_01170 [archaeon]|nr:hypothetical protein [archaeon]
MESDTYGIGVDVPKDFLEMLMDCIDEVMEPLYPGYRRSFRYYPVTGTWLTLEGSNPFIGSPGKISVEEEYHLEFVVKKEDLGKVLKVIDEKHPYEEPAVDVVPQIGWREALSSSLRT